MTAKNRAIKTKSAAAMTANTFSPEAEKQLRRMTLANMLWENQFYIDGVKNVDILKNAVGKVAPARVQEIALEAREKFKLRHVPLMLMRQLAAVGKLEAKALASVIQRPDEIGEFISLYWDGKRTPLANQVKKGLAAAFGKFNEYQFAKWDKNNAAVKLRDAMFLCHPKPQNTEQTELFKKIAENALKVPDTWETNLSAGADKRETFTRLLQEKKLGALAFIRNLRNMRDSGVDESLIRSYARNVNTERVLPFRFIAAARMVPEYQDMLEDMMLRSLKDHEKLAGKTALLIDVSGSMFGAKVSGKSDLDRFDAAAALAVLAREICEDVEIYSFSNHLVKVDKLRGFKLIEAIRNSQSHQGTSTGQCVAQLNASSNYDRCVVFTDEQANDYYGKAVPSPKGKGYIINVAAYENGITNKQWMTITGMSEAVVDFIIEAERFGW